MVRTCERMVRVLNIQASEATTSAITSVVISCTLPAMTTRMAMAGTVISASATTRMVPSTGPRKLPATSPSTVPAPTPMNPASKPHLQRVGRGEDEQRQHVAALRVGPEQELGRGRLARQHRAHERVALVDEERPDQAEERDQRQDREAPDQRGRDPPLAVGLADRREERGHRRILGSSSG